MPAPARFRPGPGAPLTLGMQPLDTQIALRLPADRVRELDALAARNGSTRTQEARLALVLHLERADREQRVRAMTDEQLDAALAGDREGATA